MPVGDRDARRSIGRVLGIAVCVIVGIAALALIAYVMYAVVQLDQIDGPILPKGPPEFRGE